MNKSRRENNEVRAHLNNVDGAVGISKIKKTFTSLTSVIRFLPSIRSSEKW